MTYPFIDVQIIADSIHNTRITTMHLMYPRFIHSEFMTHRVFSRNARSSRATPVKAILKEPIVYPAAWQGNKGGMQPSDDLMQGEALSDAMAAWFDAARHAKAKAQRMMEAGLHKQWANRILEPYTVIHTLVTSTEWDNFFALRCHPDAQLEIRLLAEMMRDKMEASKPQCLDYNEWHLPYVDSTERSDEHLAISAARCARVSYKPFDAEQADEAKDLALAKRLSSAEPPHASPFEHQASPQNGQGANYHGWISQRRMMDLRGW